MSRTDTNQRKNKMITSKDVKILDINSQYFGTSIEKLMENAGSGAAKFIKKNYNGIKPSEILVIANHGNNGGDGFVVARKLNCNVYFIGQKNKLKGAAKKNYNKLKKKQFVKKIGEPKLIVDAIFGVGISGEIRDPYKTIIKNINKLHKAGVKVISLDIPSGLNPDTGKGKLIIKADKILTFHDDKPGLKRFGKKVKVVPIGIPKKANELIGPGELFAVTKKRKMQSYKGQHGKVLIISGSEKYPGAPLLAAQAICAYRAGIDWVTIATPEKVAWVIHTYAPELITHKIKTAFFQKKHVKQMLKLEKDFDCVLIGPGIGIEASDFVRNYVKKSKKPLVIDADALKAINIQDVNNAILTPHRAELKQLLKNSKLSAHNFHNKLKNNIILVKGNTDTIISKDKVKYNKTGNPAMTVAGTGDVLAGLAAGFLAQSNDLFNSAAAASFINGYVGDKVYKKIGQGLLPSDLIQNISVIIKKLLKE